MTHLRPIPPHPGFARVFAPGRTTLGLMFPMAPLENGVADMSGQSALAARADQLGFAALWSRDVPLFDPEFGDAGQTYDPWVWLGHIAAVTQQITLSTAGIVLPLRHPLHTAKAAASVDALSGGRFMLGAASGDRASEYPAFNRDHATRGVDFREQIAAIRTVTSEAYPVVEGGFGRMEGLDMLPKPPHGRLPLLAVGGAQQSVQWIAAHMDGWVTYPRDIADQRKRVGLWRMAVEQKANGAFRPFAQSLFIDLTDDPDAAPSPIFLGFRLGRNRLIDHLHQLNGLGVHHVMFNLRHSVRPAREVIEELGSDVLAHFPSHDAPALAAAA
ncbi:MAG: LLM class oxidoreductase [Caulobacterales bacterium]|nr:LLM class oxidoreductase [Caulobacterales bacterium]